MWKRIFILVFVFIILTGCAMNNNPSHTSDKNNCQSGIIAVYAINNSQSPIRKVIILIDVASKQVDNFTTNSVFQMSFSPKEHKIAFSQVYLDINGIDLALLDVSNGNITRVENKFDDFHPVWSPTGDELIYISGPEFSFELHKLDVVQMTSSIISLPFSDKYKHIVPMDWNEKYILFRGHLNSETDLSSDSFIFFQPDTNKWFVGYESSDHVSTVLFSPSASILLIEEGGDPADSKNPPDIFFYDWGKNEKIDIPEIQGWSRSPAWSPDGNCLAFLYNSQIVIFSFETKKIESIYDAPDKNMNFWYLDWGDDANN